MDEGQDWLKLHRRILENDFLRNDKTAFFVFMKLLLLVGKIKGEWSGSVRKLAGHPDIDMNYMTLYKVLKRLEGENIIRINGTFDKQEKPKNTVLGNKMGNKKYSVISICNWHIYQERRVTSKVTHGKQTGNTRVTHGKQPTPVKKNTEENRREKNNKDDFFEKEFDEFITFRKTLKKPLTPHAQELLMQNLDKLYPGDREKQALCLQQSIINGWQGVFELKNTATPVNQLKIEEW